MGSKRSQDFLLVMSSLQKVANLVAKQEMSAMRKAKSDYSSLNQLAQNAKCKFDPVSFNDGQHLAKSGTVMLENALVMSQALAVSSMQHALKDLNFEHSKGPRQDTPTAREASRDNFKTNGDHYENTMPKYEPNASITALELIEKMPDLTDRRKIISTMFVKKTPETF